VIAVDADALYRLTRKSSATTSPGSLFKLQK